MEQGRMSIAMLLAQYNGLPSSATSIERIIGIDAIRAKLTELSAACRSAVWSLNPGGAHSPSAIKSSQDLTAESLHRGIEVRSIHNDSVRNDPPTLQHLQQLDRMGAAVRTHPVIPVRLIIVDRERIVIPVDTQFTAASALLITGTGLVEALVALYLHTWEQAKPLTKTRPRRELELNDQERYALRLWAKGHTDATVSRKLGVSERTVRRISETVAEKLRTESRFQAGARAAFAGWITEDDTI
jgi:DNA-binding CsgD family transcriptional regulator